MFNLLDSTTPLHAVGRRRTKCLYQEDQLLPARFVYQRATGKSNFYLKKTSLHHRLTSPNFNTTYYVVYRSRSFKRKSRILRSLCGVRPASFTDMRSTAYNFLSESLKISFLELMLKKTTLITNLLAFCAALLIKPLRSELQEIDCNRYSIFFPFLSSNIP